MQKLFRFYFVLCVSLLLLVGCVRTSNPIFSTTERVGHVATNRVVTPVNQVLTPIGIQVELNGVRPQAIALSPNGKLLAVSGKSSEVLLVDPVTGKILQRVPLPSDKAEPDPEVVSPNILEPDKKGQVSYTGLIFSPNGSRIFLANVNGSIKVFDVNQSNRVAGEFSIELPHLRGLRRTNEIPAGLAISHDGKRLYVAFNLSNKLGEFDAESGELLRTFDVGVAPYDVVLIGDKAYVSNWGGRRPQTNDVTGPAGRGTKVKVDPVRFIANEGSVSVVNLNTNQSPIANSQSAIRNLKSWSASIPPRSRCIRAGATSFAQMLRVITSASSTRARTKSS